jgi:cobalt/nickel transport system permease protein
MHIPDGFLSPPVWSTLDVLSVPAVGWMAKRAQRDTLSSDPGDRRIPLLGVMGAFIFAAQMINFPLGMGTSGHLVGGALMAVILGPAAASIVMTAILAIQAFVFQDGGVMALGANILNMAIVGVLAGYLPYRMWGSSWRSAAIFTGGVLSVLASACLALSQLIISGVPVGGRLLWISLGLFLLSAVAEGAITLAAVNAIERLNPGWVRRPAHGSSRVLGAVAIASVAMICIALLFASAAPDGIQSVLAQAGGAAHIDQVWQHRVSAAFTGMALLYAACLLTGRLVSRRSA